MNAVPGAAEPAAESPASFARHLSRTLKLAGPIILSRVGVLMMTTLDVVVVGRAGAQELAFYVLGYAIYDSLLALMAGLSIGVPTLVSRSLGEGRDGVAGAIWRRGLLFAVLIGLALACLLQLGPWLFGLTGQDELLATGGGRVLGALAFGLPFFGMFLVSATFLEALERPYIATVAVVIANVVNLVLSVALVFGFGPIPALGAWGCALATVITSAGLGIGLAGYVWFFLPGRERFGLRDPKPIGVPGAREQVVLGFAAGASYALEAGSFGAITLIAGLLGTVQLAAVGVLFQLFALAFMVSFGIAGSTQVRVGNAWGRRNRGDIFRAGLVGFALSVVCSFILSVVFLALPSSVIGLLTTDETVIIASLPIVGWMVAALVADGGQSVLNHACRGRGDSWAPTLFHFISYWCVMVPVAYWLAVPTGGQGTGLYQAILLSSLISLVLMGLRFRHLSSRPFGPTENATGT
ncbi:MAG: MATE family efflux transporter [Pseudomonadota bacterium]